MPALFVFSDIHKFCRKDGDSMEPSKVKSEDVRLRFYREFRLCMTPADSGGAKGIGLSPYPYQLFTKEVFQ